MFQEDRRLGSLKISQYFTLPLNRRTVPTTQDRYTARLASVPRSFSGAGFSSTTTSRTRWAFAAATTMASWLAAAVPYGSDTRAHVAPAAWVSARSLVMPRALAPQYGSSCCIEIPLTGRGALATTAGAATAAGDVRAAAEDGSPAACAGG